ncbi:MAG TPA: ABC transporter permease/substrate-binding protein [Gammaproteobacteria bacterium]|nr:ABC transporter permease/substrate-binding protein [Gammaproteobacteria bacterium]
MSEVWLEQFALLPGYLSRHLLLSVTALAVGIGLSMPLAFAAIRHRWLQGPILTIASTIQTVPGLALLALMVPLLGQIGFVPAVIALILYSMLPVLRNTVTGIEQVDRDFIEAGRGLGMTPNQLLLRVQLPLAFPVIVAGIRTATVWVVGIATLSTPVGATSLGNFIFSGLQTQNYAAVLVGCAAAAALALILDRLIRLLEIALARRDRAMLGGAVLLTVAALTAGLWPILRSAALVDGRPDVVIGTKTFTEQYILGELIADVLEVAGFDTNTRDSLGSTVAFDALAAERIDVYVDYTGTIWANYMQRDDNPGRETIRSEVARWLIDEHGIEVAATLGFENAYVLAMTRAGAESLGVGTIDGLVAHAPSMKMGGDYEFFGRPEWASLSSRYGLQFDELVTMDSTLMYAAVAAGEVDVITAFSTDGRIHAFDLAILDDTRGALPPYDAVLLVAPNASSRVPGLLRALGALDNAIDVDLMRSANRHVDLDGGSVSRAAEMITAQLMFEAEGRP